MIYKADKYSSQNSHKDIANPFIVIADFIQTNIYSMHVDFHIDIEHVHLHAQLLKVSLP